MTSEAQLGNNLKEFCVNAVRDYLKEQFDKGDLAFTPATIMDIAEDTAAARVGSFYTRFIEDKDALVRMFGNVKYEGKPVSECENVPDGFVSILGDNLIRFEVVSALIFLHQQQHAAEQSGAAIN